ncbi:MAG: hypothetical protein QMD65_00540 [Patescibacteria group bacterium]|nr:hypothetical protein [Patescibacteria group bacterium]
MTDEWGGIDEKIKETITILNLLGITTTGSCEGHIDYSAPAPWIKITALHEPKKIKQNKEAYWKWQNENQKFRQKTLKLLNEFYKDRIVAPDIRLVIENAKAGFWIHNGGKDYKQWREIVQYNASKKEKDRKNYMDDKEKVKRKKILHDYQKEMQAFTKFLKEKIK